jgi:hypothetical protein
VPGTRKQVLSDEDRAERRADREYARQAVERLRSSEGWRRWLATRRHFHAYSWLILRAAVIDRVEWARGRRRHVIDAGPVRT